MIDYYTSTVGNDRTIRITHGNDPVPMLTLDSGYVHPALEIYYPDESDGEYIICDGSGSDPNCIVSYSNLFGTDDHLEYLGIEMDCNIVDDFSSRQAEWRIVNNMTMDELDDYRSKLEDEESQTTNKDNINNKDNGIRTAIIISGIIGGVIILCLAIGYYCKYKRMGDGVNVNVNVSAASLGKIENEKNGDYVPPNPTNAV